MGVPMGHGGFFLKAGFGFSYNDSSIKEGMSDSEGFGCVP